MGAPYEMNGPYQTGDVYKCSLSRRTNGNGCSKLNLGIVSQNTTQCFTSESQHTLHKVTATIMKVQNLNKCACMYCIGVNMSACFSASVSVNIMVTCVRQKCGYHTNHSTFYYIFQWFMYISTCGLYRTSHHMLLHTGCTCVVLVR